MPISVIGCNITTKQTGINVIAENLNDLNIQKVLGRGEINKKINITVNKASKKAIEKVEAAGGKTITKDGKPLSFNNPKTLISGLLGYGQALSENLLEASVTLCIILLSFISVCEASIILL